MSASSIARGETNRWAVRTARMVRGARDVVYRRPEVMVRLVLGGRGFVGSAFVRHADAHGVEVRAVGRDDYASALGTSCEVLINAAGNARKYRADADPRWDFDESVRSVLHSL